MKRLILSTLGLGILVGAVLALNRSKAPPAAPAQSSGPVASAPGNSTGASDLAQPSAVVAESPKSPSAQALTVHPSGPPDLSQARQEAAELTRSVDTLVSPQSSYDQKQATWKQLRDTGKLDQAIVELQERVAADPNSAQNSAALGQAYLKKCATTQDVREQGMLALQADKLFENALSLDPSNWDARFTKAVAMSYWPPTMNKGDEVVQQFQTLIQQQESQPPQSQFADSYVWLGDQYQKSGKVDSAQNVWQRGASLFPNNETLRAKLAALNTPANPAPASGQ